MLSLGLRTVTVTLLAVPALVACGTAHSDGDTTGDDDGAVTVDAELVEQPDAEVEMRMFDFRPGEVEVAAGETVEFANTDETRHTITSEEERFDEELDGTGERVQITFDEPGTYAFFCRPHNFMTGTVTVTS